MNDQKIIQCLKSGQQSKGFVQLYKGFPMVNKLIQSKGGSKEEAEDIFQEALIIFYKKAKKSNFKLTAAISTYIYSVARYLWSDKLKLNNKTVVWSKEQEFTDYDDWENLIEEEKKFQQAEKVLESIGERCLKILQLFYYHGLSMKEIAKKVDLKSEKVAKNQKYKCLEKARQKWQDNLITNN